MSDLTSFASEFRRGALRFMPVAISVAAYGLVWGVLAGQKGLTLAEVALMSGLVFAGASQFVALDMWQADALPIASIVVATLIVNLRLVLMSATMRPLVAHLPAWRALATMFFVSDESWAMTMAERDRGGAGLAFFLGTGTLCWLSWMGSTVAGRLVGSVIEDPMALGLDFAFTATFLALLLGMWKGRTDLVPWIVGGLVAVLVSRLIEGNWYIIAGGLVGSLAGAFVETRRRADVA
jgi:4-azaleucine resistance transporter AzlC